MAVCMTQGCSSLRKNIFNRVVADIIAVKRCTERKQQNVLVSKSAYGHVWYKILFSAAVFAGQQEALYSSVPDYFTRGMQRRRTANTPVKSFKLSLFPSAPPFTCNFFSICHLQR